MSGTDLEWPHAKVLDRAAAPALGWPALVGAMVAGLGLYRGDLFELFGGVCFIALGLGQLLRPNLVGVKFREARLFVHDATLTIDGNRVDVARVLRSETLAGPVVVIDERRGSSISVLCATPEERRALLRALGTPASTPVVFAYAPWFMRFLLTIGYFAGVGTVLLKVLHVMPPELGWRPLWLMSIAMLGFVVHWRLEITKDELRLHRDRIRLRAVSRVGSESAPISGIPSWLVVEHETIAPAKVLILGRLAPHAAAAVEKSVKRAKASAPERGRRPLRA